jgi:hypothetical protein
VAGGCGATRGALPPALATTGAAGVAGGGVDPAERHPANPIATATTAGDILGDIIGDIIG